MLARIGQIRLDTIMYSHSPERAAASLHLSELVYEAAHAQVDGETRDRQTLRLGITTLGYLLRFGESPSDAGDVVHSLLVSQLGQAGVHPSLSVYDAWPSYQDIVARLPHVPIIRMGGDLSDFSNGYADVRRGTMIADGSLETDASHVFHLMSLALPYAAEHYPTLDQGTLAAYMLLHDAPERVVGDTRTLTISPEALAKKYQDEKLAMEALSIELADYPELFQLIRQYEAQQDPESRFVRTWDKYDVVFTHFLNNGLSLYTVHSIRSVQDFRDAFEAVTRRISSYGRDFPLVMEDRLTLLTEIAHIVPWTSLPNATIKT